MGGEIALILKIFGISMVSIVGGELLDANGEKAYGHYIKIGATILCVSLVTNEIMEIINAVLTTFKLM